MLATHLFAADPPRGPIGLLVGLIAQWPLWLPVLVGAVGVYFLLPRPRAYPWFWGAVAGVLALLLGGTFLVQTGSVWQETLLFYVFSAVTLSAGVLLVTQQNPARAALSFTLVILATCGLFLLLAAPFLMVATIIVYAGAIVVTFLFVIMLAQQEGRSDADARSREPLLATLTGFVLLATLLYVIKSGGDAGEYARLEGEFEKQAAADVPPNPYGAGIKLMDHLGYKDLQEKIESLTNAPGTEKEKAEKYEELKNEGRRRAQLDRLTTLRPTRIVHDEKAGKDVVKTPPLSDLSGPPASVAANDLRRDEKTGLPASPAENSAYLGRSLFTDYLLPVELGGLLLLVATVGAVAIGQRREKKPAGGGGDAVASAAAAGMVEADGEARTVKGGA